MHKITKIFISFLFIIIFSMAFQTTFAKYVIEDIHTVAKLDIDRCKPTITLMDITSSNNDYPNYANKNHTITGHIKLTEKNIIRNNFSLDNIQILVENEVIEPFFKTFSLISDNGTEKVYEFSFTNTTTDGSLVIFIPEGVVEDKSGLINDETSLFTGMNIDNTPPIATFNELESIDNKSKAEVTANEAIRPLDGWDISDNHMVLSKDFNNHISYEIPIIDLAENSTEVLVDIKNATNIMLQYGTYDDYSKQTLVSSGEVSSPNTISSNSICKTEAIYMKLSGRIPSSYLQGRCYIYTHWGDGASDICYYSELPYYHGYNPWFNYNSGNNVSYKGSTFTQLGGNGVNSSRNVDSPHFIPSDIASKYPYGISGVQFRLENSPDFSIVYQVYVKGMTWLKASSDGEENFYEHTKPISAFRMNIVPKSEKQRLIDYWNKDAKFWF